MQIIVLFIAFFVFSFSIFLILELEGLGKIGVKIVDKFQKKQFELQRIGERDQAFDLFPLAPDPLLLNKINVVSVHFLNFATHGAQKYLGALFAAIFFGYLATILTTLSPTFMGFDFLNLVSVFFGVMFFSNQRSVHTLIKEDKLESRVNNSKIGKLWWIFIIFAVLVPFLFFIFDLSAENTAVSSTEIVATDTVGQTFADKTASVEEQPNTPDLLSGRIFWFAHFLRIAATILPFILFGFSHFDSRSNIDQVALENEGIGLGSITRMKEPVSLIFSGLYQSAQSLTRDDPIPRCD